MSIFYEIVLFDYGVYSAVYTSNNVISNGTITNGSNYIEIATKNDYKSDVFKRWVDVDLTNYSKIQAKATCNSPYNWRFVAWISQSSSAANARNATASQTAEYTNTGSSLKTVELDISTRSGVWYVAVGTDTNNASWSSKRTVDLFSVKLL